MKNHLDNILCERCGHEKQYHYLEHWIGGGSDLICCENGGIIYHLCVFKMDNLKYLEMKYEAKKNKEKKDYLKYKYERKNTSSI